jgi:hypothetical protein
MVLFTAPLFYTIVAGIGGGVAGGLLGGLLGGGKKEQAAEAVASTYHAPYSQYQPTKVYSPTISRVYAPSPVYQIESPGAYIAKKDTARAEANGSTVSPTYAQPYSVAPVAAPKTAEGIDLTKIAIVGAIGLIGYGVVKEVL